MSDDRLCPATLQDFIRIVSFGDDRFLFYRVDAHHHSEFHCLCRWPDTKLEQATFFDRLSQGACARSYVHQDSLLWMFSSAWPLTQQQPQCLVRALQAKAPLNWFIAVHYRCLRPFAYL